MGDRGQPLPAVNSEGRHFGPESGERVDPPRCCCKKFTRVFLFRVRVDLCGRTLFDQLSVLHDDDAIADLGCDAQVMGDEQHGQAEVSTNLVEQIEHLRLDRHVKRRNSFIRNQNCRFHRERSRDADPLTLSARELMRKPVE